MYDRNIIDMGLAWNISWTDNVTGNKQFNVNYGCHYNYDMKKKIKG
jgi:hypothetical protein